MNIGAPAPPRQRLKTTARKSTGGRPPGIMMRMYGVPIPQTAEEVASEGLDPKTTSSHVESYTFANDPETAFARTRLPEALSIPRNPSHAHGIMSALTVGWQPGTDPRLWQMASGFPVSVHPLRIPNTRALFSSGSTDSVIDFKFVRLAGLLHKMIPLHPDIDDVQLHTVIGGHTIEVFGHVDVKFDAMGHEFNLRCWVINVGPPVEMILGGDFSLKYELALSFAGTSGGSGPRFESAKARKVEDIQEIYTTE